MKAQDCVPLVEITRGEVVESIHYGAYIVVDSSGKVLAGAGNPELTTFPRSSMKPFQALPLIEQGGDKFFNLTEQEIAITCASHSGTDLHQSVISSMHEKIGLTIDDLACGIHWPGDSQTRKAMIEAGQEPTPLHHNCSGKHTGMLAQACLRGLEKKDYIDPQHPVQITIRQTLADMVELAPESMALGVDGCSAPVYAIPLLNMALGVAKLADPGGLGVTRSMASRKITAAMMNHPVMVAGPGKFDTVLMTAAKGKLFSKGGAEGYQIIGVMPGASWSKNGLGIAIKIADGDQKDRARAVLSVHILSALGVLNEQEQGKLSDYRDFRIKNWRGLVVGEVKPVITLVSP